MSIISQVQNLVDQGTFAGAVLAVADRDRILFHEAAGFARIENGEPMRPDSMIWIASQTKPVTATAVMMLVDEGRVALDDPISKYLPEFEKLMFIAEKDDDHLLLHRIDEPITLRQTLAHTSGLPFCSPLEWPGLDRLSVADGVRSNAMMPLQAKPNTQWIYSNAGINTAARVLEVVTGTEYAAFLQERLFDPLGMTDTTFWPTGVQLERLAQPYWFNSESSKLEPRPIEQLTYPLDAPTRTSMAAGGLFSTASDMARFCQMILRGGEWAGRRYLSEAAVAEMTRRQTPAHLEASYGLGWAVDGWVGHGGALSSDMTIFSKEGLVTIWHGQHSGLQGAAAEACSRFKQSALEQFSGTTASNQFVSVGSTAPQRD